MPVFHIAFLAVLATLGLLLLRFAEFPAVRWLKVHWLYGRIAGAGFIIAALLYFFRIEQYIFVLIVLIASVVLFIISIFASSAHQ